MIDGFDTIRLSTPLEQATFLDLCRNTGRQRELKLMKEASLEEMLDKIPDESLARMAYEAVQECREGYMRIRRQYPSLGEPQDGWTYIFAEKLPLFLDRPDAWYHTSNIQKIDWQLRTFTTLNSVYSFEFIEME